MNSVPFLPLAGLIDDWCQWIPARLSSQKLQLPLIDLSVAIYISEMKILISLFDL